MDSRTREWVLNPGTRDPGSVLNPKNDTSELQNSCLLIPILVGIGDRSPATATVAQSKGQAVKKALLTAALTGGLLISVVSHWSFTPAHAQRAGLKSLRSLYDVAQGTVRDTNGDGHADSVAARVIVPAAPTPGDVEAATNLAARLGFETTALSLPIVVRDSDVAQPASIALPILVGRQNSFVRKLVDARPHRHRGAQARPGADCAVASPLGGGDGIVVVGGDDEGTLNAGVELAARLPRVWWLTGITLPAIEEQAAAVSPRARRQPREVARHLGARR